MEFLPHSILTAFQNDYPYIYTRKFVQEGLQKYQEEEKDIDDKNE